MTHLTALKQAWLYTRYLPTYRAALTAGLTAPACFTPGSLEYNPHAGVISTSAQSASSNAIVSEQVISNWWNELPSAQWFFNKLQMKEDKESLGDQTHSERCGHRFLRLTRVEQLGITDRPQTAPLAPPPSHLFNFILFPSSSMSYVFTWSTWTPFKTTRLFRNVYPKGHE